MDRPLGAAEVRRRRLRGALRGLAIAAGLLAVFLVLPGWVQPSVRRVDVRVADVVRGPVEATVSAAGRVVPEHEHVLSSPIDSRVERLLRKPGDEVAAGQPILRLDVGESEAAVAALDDRLALKTNAASQVELELSNQLAELESQYAVEELELRSLRIELERRRRSFDAGLETDVHLRKAETDVGRTEIELSRLDQAKRHARQQARARLDGLALELKMLRRDRDEAQRRLALAATVADRPGVLTWVVASEGIAIKRGQELARLADLSSFGVEATVSDVHTARVRAGQAVVVRTGEHQLRGAIAGVRPTVTDGVLTLDVRLDQPAHPALRHNLRVDVEVVTERRPLALTLKRGPLGRVDGRPAVFVVRGDVARRTSIELGISSFDTYEIRAGLAEGDQVIVSDMDAYMHNQEVRLK